MTNVWLKLQLILIRITALWQTIGTITPRVLGLKLILLTNNYGSPAKPYGLNDKHYGLINTVK